MVFVLIETFDLFDGGENLVSIDKLHFVSNAQNFIGFGLTLSPVKFFKVIQCPQIPLDLD